ncbi:DUF6503 family protein [uncultured Aquimarina sp.]|uniref:DUF6503 family protein n=1 Tax=uncultured Aquimarina sp. TaxID=575652 RepID=UPI00261F67BC|nr:DUF6503 family protein [uncultured Aquimarina sp.]
MIVRKTIKTLFFQSIFLGSLFFLCGCSPTSAELNGREILQKSKKYHDPSNIWGEVSFDVYIQEPRIANSTRYSIIKMNNATGSFELQRNRDQYVSTHIVEENGLTKVLLNNSETIDSTLVAKYRLQTERSSVYQKFYQIMYGLPMALNDQTLKSIDTTAIVDFNDETSYKIELELKEAVFSEFWKLYIRTSDYKLVGLEIIFPNEPDKGERLYFEKDFNYKGIIIPRIRHWHEYQDDSYSGSDIIIKSID